MFTAFSELKAQFPEDALRFATPGLGVGARSLGMGNAFTGVASDYSAIYWNPAGLVQLKSGEFSFGISHVNFNNTSTFYGSQVSYTNNATKVNAVGLVFPVETRRGSLAFALGYSRQSDFTTGMSFNGFNPLSSIIQVWAPDGEGYPPEITIAEELKLADIDTNSGTFISPIRNSVTQLGTILESGGLGNWSVATGVDIAENLSVGVTLSWVTGGYEYDRTYKEQDNAQNYTTFPFDFDELVVEDLINNDIFGFNAKFGMLYRTPGFRFGATVKTPTDLNVEETYSTIATSHFDSADVNGNSSYGPVSYPGAVGYDVITPWVFSVGASVTLARFILSGDIEYTDWTQLAFNDANPDLISLNKEMKSLFRGTANWRLGAECDLNEISLRARGGFIYNTSPFNNDPSSFDQKFVTGGLGFLLSEAAMIDVAYAHGWWKTYRVNYDYVINNQQTSRVDEDIATNNIYLTFTLRF